MYYSDLTKNTLPLSFFAQSSYKRRGMPYELMSTVFLNNSYASTPIEAGVRYFLLSCWPSDQRVFDLGYGTLCCLYSMDWGDDGYSWQRSIFELVSYLDDQLKSYDPVLAYECLSGLEKFLKSCYFKPTGKMTTTDWFLGEVKTVAYSNEFQEVLVRINDVKKELTIQSNGSFSHFLSVYDVLKSFALCLNQLLNNLMQRPLEVFLSTLFMQAIIVSAFRHEETIKVLLEETMDDVIDTTSIMLERFTDRIFGFTSELIPELIQEILNAGTIIPIPVPGNRCGSEEHKLTRNLLIPDYFIFASGVRTDLGYACEAHDRCYDVCRPKVLCDLEFRDNIKDDCQIKLTGNAREMCMLIAEIYYEGVKQFGDDSYQCR